MSDYLIQTGSNCVFVSTPELLKRDDMKPYDFKNPVIPEVIEPIVTIPEDVVVDGVTTTDNKITLDPVIPTTVEIVKTHDESGLNAIRAKLEAIDDPDEMISTVLDEFGLKLTKTMKKSTMIERAIEAAKGN